MPAGSWVWLAIECATKQSVNRGMKEWIGNYWTNSSSYNKDNVPKAPRKRGRPPKHHHKRRLATTPPPSTHQLLTAPKSWMKYSVVEVDSKLSRFTKRQSTHTSTSTQKGGSCRCSSSVVEPIFPWASWCPLQLNSDTCPGMLALLLMTCQL